MAKWMAGVRAGMERRGTVGSLRAIAQRKGLLGGKGDTLTKSDLRSLAAAARRMKGKDGHMTEEGLGLMRKVMAAANMMKVQIGAAKKG